MRIRFKILVAILFLVAISNFCRQGKIEAAIREGNGLRPSVGVRVDPRTELLCIIFRLAGNDEYNKCRLKTYAADVDEYFKRFKYHEAVRFAQRLRSAHGIGYNAPMDLAVHLSPPPDLEPIGVWDPLPEELDDRWNIELVRKFVALCRKFCKESDFLSFFQNHKDLYDTASLRMSSIIENSSHLEWFGRFFNSNAGRKFSIIVGILNGGNCYGCRVVYPNGEQQFFSVLGVWYMDEKGLPIFRKDVIETVVHEFCHSYTNPLVDKHQDELKSSGKKIFKYVSNEMKRQAYSNWKTMIYESLVRACVVRYLNDIEGRDAAEKNIEYNERRSFFWIRDFSDLLGEYEDQRERYVDLDSFFPRIVAFFNDYSKDVGERIKEKKRSIEAAIDAGGPAPKVVLMFPPNGADDVDPNIEKISITFDQPMMDHSWSVVTTGKNFPDVVGKPWYDNSGTRFNMKVKLKPDCLYEFGLNSQAFKGFKSRKGIPLAPVLVRFKTRKEK